LIGSEQVSVAKYIKNNGVSWKITDYKSMSDLVIVDTINTALMLLDIYR